MAQKITMQDVADAAGVDKATVSRVLRGDHRISEKTKIKVMESVRALDYRLDRNARNLSTNSSGLIGIVMASLNVPWLGQFLAGIERALSNSEYEILLKSTDGGCASSKRVSSALDGRHVEGVIWCDGGNPPEEQSVPLVALGFRTSDSFSVTMEDEAEPPSFETGVLVGRLILKLVAGKPVPGREIVVKRATAE